MDAQRRVQSVPASRRADDAQSRHDSSDRLVLVGYSRGRDDQPAFQLADIYNGNHDAYITQFARSAAAWGHPFFFRFDPEMNGWWLPWNEQTNGNQPGDFARAWRHVVDIFRREGATNATWVFCPNIIGPLSTPLEGLSRRRRRRLDVPGWLQLGY